MIPYLQTVVKGLKLNCRAVIEIFNPYRFCHAGSERANAKSRDKVLKRTIPLVLLSTFTRNKASKMEDIVIISSIST